MFHSPESPAPAPQAPDDLLLFAPVPVPARAGAWNSERQIAFIECLRRIGVVAAAARSVGMTASGAYRLRKRAGPASGFARAWDCALEEAQGDAIDVARTRGFEPRREAVWRRGRQVGWRERYDNRLLYAALRALDGASGRYARAAAGRGETLAAAAGLRNDIAHASNKIAESPRKA